MLGEGYATTSIKDGTTIETVDGRGVEASAEEVAAVSSTVAMTIIKGREEEHGENRFHFSKPKGVVLEKENIFFLETRRNMVTFGCWKNEKKEFFSLEIFLVEERQKLKV